MISEKDIEDMGPPQIELEAVKENPDGSMICSLISYTFMRSVLRFLIFLIPPVLRFLIPILLILL